MHRFRTNDLPPVFVPANKDILAAFWKAGKKPAMHVQEQICVLRRLFRLTIHSSMTRNEIEHSLGSLYKTTAGLQQESGFPLPHPVPERQQEIIATYRLFFLNAAPVVETRFERHFVNTALSFLKYQESLENGANQGNVHHLSRPNPFLTATVATALLLDILHHTKEETCEKYLETAAYEALHDVGWDWETAVKMFDSDKPLSDPSMTQAQCEAVMRHIYYLGRRLAKFEKSNARSDTANTPDADIRMILLVKTYLKPFEVDFSPQQALLPAPAGHKADNFAPA